MSETSIPVYQCRHIFTDGHRCGSRSLRGEKFCYYHHASRPPANRTRPAYADNVVFDLPAPEDRAAIQFSVGEVLRYLATNAISERRAALILRALQIAGANLPRPDKEAIPSPSVTEVIADPEHGPIAPEVEYHKANHEKSSENSLMEQQHHEECAEAAHSAKLTLVELRRRAAEENFTLPGPFPSPAPGSNPARPPYDFSLLPGYCGSATSTVPI